MISLHVTLGLCHLMFGIKTGSSCGGNSELEVAEMCSGGSTKARNCYLHGSPAGDAQQCDCSLTFTGVAGSVQFTFVPLTDTTATRGGTLTLPGGGTVDCTRASKSDVFLYPGTTTLTFAYNTADVRCCTEVKLMSTATNMSITCPGSTTTPTSISSPPKTTVVQSPTPATTITSISSPTITAPITTTTAQATTSPLHTEKHVSSSTSTPSTTTPLSSSTSTNVPTSTTTSPMTSSFENRSTSNATQTQSATAYSQGDITTMASPAVSPFPVAAVAGGVGAGILILLVVVVVVVLCYCRGRHVDKQEELKGPTRVTTVTNSLYESSAAINYTHPTKPLAIAEQQDNTPVVEDQISLGLTSDHQGGTPDIADHHDGTPRIAKQHDETPAIDEHRDGTTDMYALVNKPKPSSEATTTTEQPVHTAPKTPLPYVDSDLSKATKTISPPPIGENDINAKVDKSSQK